MHLTTKGAHPFPRPTNSPMSFEALARLMPYRTSRNSQFVAGHGIVDLSVMKPDLSTATVMVIGAPIGPSDIPGICARAEWLMESGVATVTCDVGAFEEADMLVVDALARLQLTVSRHGGHLRLSRVSPALRDLLEWSGLDDVFS